MDRSIAQLLSIASEPIGIPIVDMKSLDEWGILGAELAELLMLKNGFYAYESALLVRPLRSQHPPLGLLEWNAPGLWISEYAEAIDHTLFFAEDVFGGQFCIRDQCVRAFDPETGNFEQLCDSLSQWAHLVLTDYQYRTGYPLAHSWQSKSGPLRPGMRLLPKVPFICGGKYEMENLYSISDVDAMSFRASIANQMRDLPDGSKVVLRVKGNPASAGPDSEDR